MTAIAAVCLLAGLLAGPLPPATAAQNGLRGPATWYPAPTGHAAAGPALRAFLGKAWRGSLVHVCAGGRCVQVRLTDWCRCRNGRVIDLPRRDFARLAPLWVGVVRVRVART